MNRAIANVGCFIGGFVWSLSEHAARIILWAVVSTLGAFFLGLPLSWRLIMFVAFANLVGSAVYPTDGSDRQLPIWLTLALLAGASIAMLIVMGGPR